MTARSVRLRRAWPILLISVIIVAPGCISPGERTTYIKQIQRLEEQNRSLQRLVEQRESTIRRLDERIENMQSFPPERPIDLFAPVSLEIASLSGGRDYDKNPGDDGITVYLRPKDADGDVVKSPGRITIQLLDANEPGTPRVVGVCVVDEPARLRDAWHGRFLTDHYTIECPFPPDAPRPRGPQITVKASFVDFLTGRKLTAVEQLPVAPALSSAAAGDSASGR